MDIYESLAAARPSPWDKDGATIINKYQPHCLSFKEKTKNKHVEDGFP